MGRWLASNIEKQIILLGFVIIYGAVGQYALQVRASWSISDRLHRKVRKVTHLQDRITVSWMSFPHFLPKLPLLICQNTREKEKKKVKTLFRSRYVKLI